MSMDANETRKRFLECCESDPRRQEVIEKLRAAGCELPHILALLRLYIENRPGLDAGREKRAKSLRAFVNRGVRTGRLSSSTGRAMHGKAAAAFKAPRCGHGRCVDALVYVEAYIEFKTGKRPTVPELCFLIDAAAESLGRTVEEAAPDNVRRELTRFKKENATLTSLIRNDVSHTMMIRF